MRFKTSDGIHPSRNAFKSRRVEHNMGSRSRRRAASLLEQPVAKSEGAVPCPLCGHPVDPQRIQFHMERCHGTAACTRSG